MSADSDSAADSASASLPSSAFPLVRTYSPAFPLKYGLNPYQFPACALSLSDSPFPLTVINGAPGFINLLDALNGIQLVRELAAATRLPAAASFKHCSPAGAAVAVPLDSLTAEVYGVSESELSSLSPLAVSYVRARQADPKSSFGDFASFSHEIDLPTAKLISREFSDGVIAPAVSAAALELLRVKKGGAFVILICPSEFEPPEFEYRELFGVGLVQQRNKSKFTAEIIQNSRIPPVERPIPDSIITDLLVAAIASKFTQSNSVVYAVSGQIIGAAAGQQSRVDCSRLAGSKASEWRMRFHPRVRSLPLKAGLKRADRNNARILFIQGDWSASENSLIQSWMTENVTELTREERKEFLQQEMRGLAISVSSDGFFPFRDSIDEFAKRGVKFVLAPGGSQNDEEIRNTAAEHGITICQTNIRAFHH